jgi:hypothetical protein
MAHPDWSGHPMMRFSVIALLLMVSPALAQNGEARQDPGCARDVTRHCRSKMNDGDTVILACLKEHRAALSKTCAKVLTDHGQ